MKIVISRTDSIGDVILTVPLAGYLKEKFPDCRICFLGRTYTRAIIESSSNIDAFLNWDEISRMGETDQIDFFKQLNAQWFFHVYPNREIARLAKKAGIPNRVGTSHRLSHWYTCNKLLHFSRKKSNLHESQLNFKLLKPLGIDTFPALADMGKYFGVHPKKDSLHHLPVKLDPTRKNIILHPKSKGSAREWGLDNFGRLIDLLPKQEFKIFISGTSDEKNEMREWLVDQQDRVEDITGKLSLEQFVQFISQADALVAASTGPLHIASIMGIKAIGIYPPMKPMHPGRWKPIGRNAHVLVVDKNCDDCRKTGDCACMRAIKAEDVVELLVGSA
jgi:lipopolysaccharide heptosyltransferase III